MKRIKKGQKGQRSEILRSGGGKCKKKERRIWKKIQKRREKRRQQKGKRINKKVG